MAGSRLIGGKAHAARLKKLGGPAMVREVGKALFAGGDIIRVEAQLLITSGAVSGKNHVPSNPGEPPNQDTGVLGNNIENVLKAPLIAEVSSNAPYAAAMEEGNSRVEARPYMRPARDRKIKEVVQLVRNAVAHVVRTSGQ